MMTAVEGLHGGLSSLAESLQIERIGTYFIICVCLYVYVHIYVHVCGGLSLLAESLQIEWIDKCKSPPCTALNHFILRHSTPFHVTVFH
jgi:hypothetical protein